jgi:ribosomal protein L5
MRRKTYADPHQLEALKRRLEHITAKQPEIQKAKQQNSARFPTVKREYVKLRIPILIKFG